MLERASLDPVFHVIHVPFQVALDRDVLFLNVLVSSSPFFLLLDAVDIQAVLFLELPRFAFTIPAAHELFRLRARPSPCRNIPAQVAFASSVPKLHEVVLTFLLRAFLLPNVVVFLPIKYAIFLLQLTCSDTHVQPLNAPLQLFSASLHAGMLAFLLRASKVEFFRPRHVPIKFFELTLRPYEQTRASSFLRFE